MKYTTAINKALFHNWTCGIKSDGISGNGFQIFWYGFTLICYYFLQLIFRIIFAILFPLSALIIIKIKKDKNDKLHD